MHAAVGGFRSEVRCRGPGGHAISFWTGWASLVFALGPPLELWTDGSFAAHMAQHEILMLIAAPLLVAAKPAGVLMWGLPGFASRAYARLARAQRVRVLASGLCAPVAAWLIHAIVLWAWHVPAAFEAALANDGMHWAQHTSFFVAAVIFWWSVLVSGPLAERRGIATLSVFTTGVHTSILGALLTFSTQVWYPTYVRTGGIWGLTPLEDQQLGGLIMWVPGGTVFVIVGIVLVAMWLKEMEKRAAAARTS